MYREESEINAYISFFRNIFRGIRKSVELSRYNSFTIAEYVRKQGVQIGEDCGIIATSLANEPYLVKIGNHMTISGGVSSISHDGGAWILRNNYPNAQAFGSITIEDNCVIGQDAILFPNIRLGKNSTVGTGSVVI